VTQNTVDLSLTQTQWSQRRSTVDCRRQTDVTCCGDHFRRSVNLDHRWLTFANYTVSQKHTRWF